MCRNHRIVQAFASVTAVFSTCQLTAMETTKVLPKGVRSMNLRVVDTAIHQKTNRQGKALPLAHPLSQDLTFRKIAAGEDTIKGNLLRGFLLGEGIDLDTTVGSFDADLKARIRVTAPIVAYGIHEKITLALAIPYYRAATNVSIGFNPNAQAQNFLTALSRPETNQVAAAREAGDKINRAVSRLNDKLEEHGFSRLGPWEKEGMGDITLAAKVLVAQYQVAQKSVSIASTGGLVAPSGRVDDPDILTDISFGDGQWDVFGQVTFDEEILDQVTFNQSFKYTHQMVGEKKVRAILEDEKIEVPVVTTSFKPGDKWESSLSLQWQPTFGLLSGLGYGIVKKDGDRYNRVPKETARALEKDTDQSQQVAEASIGYSSVPHFQRGVAPLPMEVKLTLSQPIASQNSPVSRLTQFDLSMFF